MLDLVNEALDQVPLLVEVGVIGTLLAAVFSGWNHWNRFLLKNEVYEAVEIVAAVGNDMVTKTVGQQCFCLREVVSVSAGEENVQWISQCVNDYVNLGAESAPTATERLRLLATLFWGAPAAHGCARTIVLSGMTLSMSASSLK